MTKLYINQTFNTIVIQAIIPNYTQFYISSITLLVFLWLKPRPRHAQSLLTGVLELLRVEAKTIGLEAEATKLVSNLLSKNNYPQRK